MKTKTLSANWKVESKFPGTEHGTQCIAAKTITVKIEAAMMSVDFARFVMICFDLLRGSDLDSPNGLWRRRGVQNLPKKIEA